MLELLLSLARRNWCWKQFRKQMILHQHEKVSAMCNSIITQSRNHVYNYTPQMYDQVKHKDVIWQYWAQGWKEVPDIVKVCVTSVEKWKGNYTIIRLSDENVCQYIHLPDYIIEKKKEGIIPLAQYSDILRVCLLSLYGGLWLDATIMLTGPIPSRYCKMDFFVFQRNPNEFNKKYWENAYAYYYGWDKKFRVNMLNSIIFAHKGNVIVREMAHYLLSYWESHNELPDYFFFQILFDTLIKGKLKGMNCPIESDCTPHFMQQSINDPNFNLATREEILSRTTIHKLTYK